MRDTLKAPFPWFGGKSRVADAVWERFGDVVNYVEPFAGSLALLLARPGEPRVETVNDKDCFIANFWRALAADPEQLAQWCDWPVNEADLHARHLWLVNRVEWRERMKTDPDYFDVKIAAWWVWGISQWIGSGWCSRPNWRGRGSAMCSLGITMRSVNAVSHAGFKKNGDAQGQRPMLTSSNDVHAKRPDIKSGNRGVHRVSQNLPDIKDCRTALGDNQRWLLNYFSALSSRLRRVRVCCGDWKRVMGPSPTFKIGLTGVFLDPPYSDPKRDKNLYNEDCMEIAKEVCAWAIDNGENPLLRIALCGYEGEHVMPASWQCFAWKSAGGYSNNGPSKINATRERIWFSPACLKGDQIEMFT